MDWLMFGLPKLNLTKWITDKPYQKMIPKPQHYIQERKFLDIPILKKYADYAPPNFWKEFPANLDPPEDGKLTEINIEVIIIYSDFT